MASDIDEIIRIKRAAEEELFAIPGVCGVDVGYKYVGGERTDEIVVRVFVEHKRDVPAGERIPESIHGVRTDVQQGGFEELADTKMYRPLIGGISVGPVRRLDGSTGTLGALVTDNATQGRMALSNHHVFFDGSGSYDVSAAQPSSGDSGFIIGSVARSLYDDDVDAAVVRINEIVIPVKCEIADLGQVTGTGEPRVGMVVRKRGRTSEWTYGYIDGVDQTYSYKKDGVPQDRKGQFSVQPDPASGTRVFADGGDSGSVIITAGGQVIGLLYGSNVAPAVDGGRCGVATPIATVLKKMDVSMATAGIGGHTFTPANQGTAFDLDGSGKSDHLIFYHTDQLFAGKSVSVI